jgi:hypothetical protein
MTPPSEIANDSSKQTYGPNEVVAMMGEGEEMGGGLVVRKTAVAVSSSPP